ncbi:hypothetical protein BD770DRAFT_439307 [Pilaira anomala]|nr:hypothetical protein BD770DRAFT_439307 [Pilaira anomala]
MTTNTNNNIIITIGLWRYCIFDTTNNSNICSSIKMNFDIGSFLGVSSAFISIYLLPGNQKKSVQRKALLYCSSLFCFISATLISISFGVTYRDYLRHIQSACLIHHCASYTPGIESILLALSIGLFIISSIYCFIISNHHPLLTSSSKTQYTNSNFSFYASDDGQLQTQQPADIEEKQSTNELVWNNKERLSLRPPPPPAQPFRGGVGCRSIIDDSALKVQAKNKNERDSADSTFTSSTKEILLPPTLPFANNKRSSYNHEQSRPLSHGSGNTFGAFCGSQSSELNSPAITDDTDSSNQEFFIDYKRNTTDSVMYAATQSNHTLGTFPIVSKPISSHTCNSSLDDNYYYPFNNNSNESTYNIPEQSSSISTPTILSKRINDYLSSK